MRMPSSLFAISNSCCDGRFHNLTKVPIYCLMTMYGKLLGSSRVTALRNRGRDWEFRPRRDVHLRICSLHDVLDKNRSSGVNMLPIRFLFLAREEAGLGESRHGESIVGIGTLERAKVRRGLTYLLLELFSWLTKGLHQAVCVRSAGDDLLYRADEQANQFQELRHRFSRRWIWETRYVVVCLLEQSVEFSLQLGKPGNKRSNKLR